MTCAMSSRNIFFAVELPLDFKIICEAPSSARCTCTGRDCDKIRIEAYRWEEYANLTRDFEEHVRIDTYRYHNLDCGLINRVYIRRDGAVVFSHDESGHDGVHVVTPTDTATRNKLRAIYERLNAKAKLDTRRRALRSAVSVQE